MQLASSTTQKEHTRHFATRTQCVCVTTVIESHSM